MEKQNDQQQIQLAASALSLLEHVSLVHDALIPKDVHPLHLSDPAFWAHVAVKFSPWHEIRARAEDGSWMARFVILDAARTWARVKMIEFHEFAPITATEPAKPEQPAAVVLSPAAEQAVQDFIAQHTWSHRGPKGHSIIRKADKEVLVESLGTKADALKWLDEHARKIVGSESLQKAA